ncbi:hypothetical protein ACLB2K_031855 [Fragaria x ananassa]
MGQIVKRKKKGRLSKADLPRWSRDSLVEVWDVRGSFWHRNVKYNIDYDNYLDDDSEEDEEIRIQKKLKLMAKLHPKGSCLKLRITPFNSSSFLFLLSWNRRSNCSNKAGGENGSMK